MRAPTNLQIVQTNPLPSIRLTSGALMPLISAGTGSNAVTRSSDAKGAVVASLNASLALGFTHLDTAEVYPGYDQLVHVLRHRQRDSYFLTAKVDPTAPLHKPDRMCTSDGAGCQKLVQKATEELVKKLGVGHVDLLLLHRPPRRRNRSAQVQCARIKA